MSLTSHIISYVIPYEVIELQLQIHLPKMTAKVNLSEMDRLMKTSTPEEDSSNRPLGPSLKDELLDQDDIDQR